MTVVCVTLCACDSVVCAHGSIHVDGICDLACMYVCIYIYINIILSYIIMYIFLSRYQTCTCTCCMCETQIYLTNV